MKKLFVLVLAIFSACFVVIACSKKDNLSQASVMTLDVNNNFGSGYITEEFDYVNGKTYSFKVTNNQSQALRYFGLFPTEGGSQPGDCYLAASSRETSASYLDMCYYKLYVYDSSKTEIAISFYMVVTHHIYITSTEIFAIEPGQSYYFKIEFIKPDTAKCKFFANSTLTVA